MSDNNTNNLAQQDTDNTANTANNDNTDNPNPNPTSNGLKRTHSQSTKTDANNNADVDVKQTENDDNNNNNNNNNDPSHEPPAKKMKIASPQMPHYNSHNIYHRPPAPSSSIPIPSLPAVLDPINVEMLFDGNDNDDDNKIDIGVGVGQQVASLPDPVEEWPLCAYCSKGGDLSRCSSCRQSYYCNRECQVNHWEVHSIICQPGPPQPPPQPVGPVNKPVIQPPVNYYNNQNGGGVGVGGGHATNYDVYNAYSPRTSSGNRNRRRSSVNSSGNVNKEQYYCEECDRYFKNGQALGGHRSRVHSSRRGNNDGSGSKRKRRPKSHVPYEGNGQYVCPHCGREFASGNALGGHISGAHTKKSKRIQRNNYDGYSRRI